MAEWLKGLKDNYKRQNGLNVQEASLNKLQNNITKRDAAQFSTPNNPFGVTTAARDNYQTYPYDYYSGADCKVFFGDIWVDDIISINFSSTQNKTPIYGYASQYFDAIMRGQIIVQGSLTVAFKEVGYLNLIQALIDSQRRDSIKAIQYKIAEYNVKAKNNMAEYIPLLERSTTDGRLTFNSNGTPQIIRKQQTIEEILTSKLISNRLSVDKFGNNSKSRDFEDMAELLEDTIWGDSNGRPYAPGNSELKRVDEFDYNDNGGIRVAKKDYARALNILLTFGDINDYRAEHTLVALNDVHFLSTSMIVGPTGDPIAEEYQFIARDINKNLGSELLNINPIKFQVGEDIHISRLEDIEKIENHLLNAPRDKFVTIKLLNGFKPDSGWRRILDVNGSVIGPLNINRYQPVLDQLITLAERTINDPGYFTSLDTTHTQFIISVEDAYEASLPSINMVINQSIPNTLTYKVISPTRSNYASASVITREDLWKDVTNLPSPEDAFYDLTEQNRNRAKQELSNLELNKEQIEGDIDQIGLEKLNKKLAIKQAEEEKARAELIKAQESGDAKAIARAQKKFQKADYEEFEAQARVDQIDQLEIKDRKLTRKEREDLQDLSRDLESTSLRISSQAADLRILTERSISLTEEKDAKVQAEIAALNKNLEEKKQAEERKAVEEKRRRAEAERIKAEAEAEAKRIEEANKNALYINKSHQDITFGQERISDTTEAHYRRALDTGSLNNPYANVAAVDIGTSGGSAITAFFKGTIVSRGEQSVTVDITDKGISRRITLAHVKNANELPTNITPSTVIELTNEQGGRHLHLQQEHISTVQGRTEFERDIRDLYKKYKATELPYKTQPPRKATPEQQAYFESIFG